MLTILKKREKANVQDVKGHVSGTVPIAVRQKINILVKMGKFKSMSALVNEALKYELRKHAADILKGQRLIIEVYK